MKIAIAGKGGAGKTTIATNLALALAAGGAHKVCLIDLDLAFGDVAIVLQLDPARTLADAVALDGLDEAAFRSLITPYRRGLDTLLAPVGPIAGEYVSRALVGDALTIARRLYEYVVIDTPPFFTDQVLAALDGSDLYALLATPDIPALKNLRLTLDMFDLRGYPDAARIIVLNGADDRIGLTTSDIEYVIRTPVQAEVPWSRDVPVSLNRGVPIGVDAPDHPVSTAVQDLASEWIVGPDSSASGRGRHWLPQRRRKAVAP